MKNIAVEATVFWIIVSALLTGGTAIGEAIELGASAVVFALLFVVVAFFCWKEKKWAFLAAIVLSVVSLLGNVVFTAIEGLESGFVALSAGAFLIIPAFLVIFYSFRAYRELGNS